MSTNRPKHFSVSHKVSEIALVVQFINILFVRTNDGPPCYISNSNMNYICKSAYYCEFMSNMPNILRQKQGTVVLLFDFQNFDEAAVTYGYFFATKMTRQNCCIDATNAKRSAAGSEKHLSTYQKESVVCCTPS